VNFSFGIISIGNWQPEPFESCVPRYVAILLGVLALFQQSHNMRTTNLAQVWKIHAARSVVEGNSSIAHFYKVVR